MLQYLDKRLFVQLNGSRKVIGVLRGYDVFLNIVLDEAVEEKDGGEKVKLGMVVRLTHRLVSTSPGFDYGRLITRRIHRSSAETRS
jgi:small nuclear ribonucleoprotein (snRNP)-like protein